jgi:4-hydroxy-2-oxoglutarate aldolase
MLQGIFPAVVTPFLADGRLDLTGFAANFAAWQAAQMTGYLVLGSTGEVVHLDEREKCQILTAARQVIPANAAFMVGTGLPSTAATIEFTNLAADYGATHALVVTPHYFKSAMSTSVLINYYQQVADAARIPILLYNVPQFTGITLSIDAIARLSQHPNIVGIKDSSGDLRALQLTIANVAPDFAVFTGSAPILAASVAAQATGAILAVANFVPQLCQQIYLLAQANDPASNPLQQQLLLLSEQIASVSGVGGVKYAMELTGLIGGQVRSPLTMPDKAAQEKIAQLLLRYNLC